MSLRGIFFVVIMAIGAILNYASKPLSQKFKKSELTLKIAGLVLVLVGVVLLMVFGK